MESADALDSADKCWPCPKMALNDVGKCLFCVLTNIELGYSATMVFWSGMLLLGMLAVGIARNLTPYQRRAIWCMMSLLMVNALLMLGAYHGGCHL